MKVLITNAYFYKLDPKQWKMHQPFPPLGTLYAVSVARKMGHQVAFYDTNLSDGPESIIEILKKESPDCLIIYDDGFNYLTKMCLSVMRKAAFTMQKYGKEAGCTVITSSSDANDHTNEYHDQGADVIIKGEGEATLAELLECIKEEKEINDVAGLSIKTKDGIEITPKRPVMKNLDELPFPAWDLIDVEAYREVWLSKHDTFYLNIATTRGCPYKCNWCAKPIYGNRYNSRSPQQVVAELKYLKFRFDVDHFWMCDDIFGLKPGWVKEFKEQSMKQGLRIQYKVQSRADLLLHENTIQELVQSGLDEVWIGAESGSQKILDAMDKGITLEQIHEATTLLKDKKVKVGFFIQFGYPGETLSDIRKTIRMVLSLMPDELGISVSYPLPGTQFYERVQQELKAKTNWVDSADLAMMFQNTYPPSFYRKLHGFLHRLYRAKKMKIAWVDRARRLRLGSIVSFAKWTYNLMLAALLYLQLIWIKGDHRFSPKVN